MPTAQDARILIIGAGHAGGSAAAALRQYGHCGPVTIMGEERVAPYQRPPLSKGLLTGDVGPAETALKPDEFWRSNDIRLRTGVRAVELDGEARRVYADDGREEVYDALILATGARPKRPPFPGVEGAGVHVLRTLDDALALRARLQNARRLVVIGGGYIGLEAAAVARSLGVGVTVLEAADRVLARVSGPRLSAFYEDAHRAAGVELVTGAKVAAFLNADGALRAVGLADGREIAADVALLGVGVVPNLELAAAGGLACDDGVLVDGEGRTSDPQIFAIGDVANQWNPLFQRRLRLESVQNALDQARAVAGGLAGKPPRLDHVPWFWSDQYDLKLQIAGLIDGFDTTVLRGDPAENAFAIYYLQSDRVLACEAVNAAADFMAARQIIARGLRLSRTTIADPELTPKDLLKRGGPPSSP